MLVRSFTLIVCAAFAGCEREGRSDRPQETIPLMGRTIDFGLAAYRTTVERLEPQIDYGPDGERRDTPWSDSVRFRRWLETLELGKANTETLLEVVQPVSLALNHGPLLGIERFIKVNTEADHKVREAGFLIFGTGPNGDFIVVDVRDGSGRTGWLPMAMIWGIDAKEVREHFVPTNKTLGDFVRASEEDWLTVPKDWYDARDEAAKTK